MNKYVLKLKEVWKLHKERWKSKSNPFWEKVKSRAVKVGTTAFGVLSISAYLRLPSWFLMLLSWVVVAAIFIYGSAKFTTQ